MKYISKKLPKGSFVIIFLVGLLLVKSLLTLYVWHSGFVEYSADGFTRSLKSWEWMEHGWVYVDIWLPFQFWLNGSLMHLWHDPLLVPRAINFAASIITTVCFFWIGRLLFGRLNAYLSALLAALFPWAIWYSLSGLAESLTYLCLSLHLVFFLRWLNKPRLGYLYAAGICLFGAAGLRYEAWFYSLVYLLLVVVISRSRKFFSWRLLVPLALPFLFMAFWCGLSWIQTGSPIAFAQRSSDFNLSDERNHSLDTWQRLIVYPTTFLSLDWRLTIPIVLASLALGLKGTLQVRVYLALIWGEFGIFVIQVLFFNTIGPESRRYPVLDLLLLLPVLAYAIQFVFNRIQWEWLKFGLTGGLVTLIVAFEVASAVQPQTAYPDGASRQVAEWFRQAWQKGDLAANALVYMDLPPTSQSDYGDSYAIRVLSRHPDNFVYTSQSSEFNQCFADQENPPLAWLQLTDARENDDQKLTQLYRTILDFGNIRVGYKPFFKPGKLTPSGEGAYHFSADEFDPGEEVYSWVSEGQQAKSLGTTLAASNGQFQLDYKAVPGDEAITAHGKTSGRYAIARFKPTSVWNGPPCKLNQ